MRTATATESDRQKRDLLALAARYAGDASPLTFEELCAGAAPPWASVYAGAAGLALAFTHPAARRFRLSRYASARRLLAELLESSESAGHYDRPEQPIGAAALAPSCLYGPGGVDYVRARIERGAVGEPARASFRRRALDSAGAPAEVCFGEAGMLTSLVLLHRVEPEEATTRAAAAVAARLIARAEGPSGWSRLPQLGFAHGRAGILYSLVDWAHATGAPLPRWTEPALASLASDVERHGRFGAPDAADGEDLSASWCNGAAGLATLWARAFEWSGEPLFLARAERAAAAVVELPDSSDASLCCGDLGRAFALLSTDRVAPGRGWDAKALALATRGAGALLREGSEAPNSLFRGFPALVWLAVDLASPASKRAGFPTVEG